MKKPTDTKEKLGFELPNYSMAANDDESSLIYLHRPFLGKQFLESPAGLKIKSKALFHEYLSQLEPLLPKGAVERQQFLIDLNVALQLMSVGTLISTPVISEVDRIILSAQKSFREAANRQRQIKKTLYGKLPPKTVLKSSAPFLRRTTLVKIECGKRYKRYRFYGKS